MTAKSAENDEPITDINVTPMVDVSLVLVIIFMAIAPLAITAGIRVLQSMAKAAVGKVAVSDNVEVRLDKGGVLSVNGRRVHIEEFLKTVSAALSSSRDKMVIVTANSENRVGEVVRILDESRQAGAVKLAIMKSEAKK